MSSVEIEVNVPEDRVALKMKEKDKPTLIATFGYLPGREFEVTIKNSPPKPTRTQTYAVRVVMPAPDDDTILPGMTATIQPYLTEPSQTENAGYAVPLDAVPVDGLGNYFVWKISEHGDGTATVSRVNVKVGEMIKNDILVVEGLQQGDRIAAAGVQFCRKGRKSVCSIPRMVVPPHEHRRGLDQNTEPSRWWSPC